MLLPRNPMAVIFDMDGLLVDTEIMHREAMMAAIEASGHNMSVSMYMGTIGMPSDAARDTLVRHYGSGIDIDAVWADASERFHDMTLSCKYMKTGVEELLDALDAIGMRRAIATSSRHQAVDRHLSAHGLDGRFDAVVAHGDYTRGKPNPDPFLKAAELLDVAPAFCLALEDSHNGVRAASEAGMMTIMIPDLLHATDEMHQLCIRIADDLHEVRDLIEATT